MEEKENTENAEMGKRKHSHDTKIVIKYYYERIRQNTGNFLKWMGLSVLTGLVVGRCECNICRMYQGSNGIQGYT